MAQKPKGTRPVASAAKIKKIGGSIKNAKIATKKSTSGKRIS